MKNTEQYLNSAIGELRCISPYDPATLEELTALSLARDNIEQLLRTCVSELRAQPQSVDTWEAIAEAVGAPSASAARQLYGAPLTVSDKRALSFWKEHAERFAWDFLPVDFLHALYTQWMSVEFPDDTPLSSKTFTRRLKGAVTASGEWIHMRSRPGALMNAAEPLASGLRQWEHDGTNAAIYGFRRSMPTS